MSVSMNRSDFETWWNTVKRRPEYTNLKPKLEIAWKAGVEHAMRYQYANANRTNINPSTRAQDEQH